MKELMKVFFVERMETEMFARRVYVGECVGSGLESRPRKRCIGSGSDCLKKRGLNVGQTRRMVYDRSEWQAFVRGNTWGIARGMNP